MVSLLACRAALFAAATVCVTAAAPAHAQASPQSEQARYREAHGAIARKAWAEARELLRRLWADSPTYDVASSLALVEYQLGDYPLAATHLAFALEHVAPVEKPETVERMRNGMAELRGKVGGLRLGTNEPRALVSLDGQSVARSLLGQELFVAPGRHVIEARAEGAAPARQVLDVIAGQTYTVELELRALPATVAAAPLPAVSAASVESDRAEERPWWPLLVGGSLTATGIGLAVGFGVAANDAKSEWRSRQSAISPSGCAERPAAIGCSSLHSAIDRQHEAATWSTIGVGVSVLSVAATAAYLLLWPAKPARLTPALSVGSRTAELGIGGTF